MNLSLIESRCGTIYRKVLGRDNSSQSQDRTKRVKVTAFAAVGAKIVALVTAIVSIRLTLPYVGAERYGMWMTMVSSAAMLSFSDLGISSTVTTFIASRGESVHDREAQVYISSAFVLLLSTAGALLACFFLVFPFVPWASLFNVHSTLAVAEAAPTTALFVLGTILCIPLSLVGRVQFGLQQGHRQHLWTAIGSIASLLGVALCARYAKSLTPFVAVTAFCPLLAIIGNWLFFFTKTESRLRPRLSLFRGTVARGIASSGSIFLLQQIFSAVTYGVDGLIIVRVLGPAAVAEYSVAQRLFAMAILSQFLSLPLWPAFGDALARKDKDWLRRSIPRAACLNIGMNVAAGIFLAMSGRPIIRLWTSGSVVPGIALLIAFTLRSGQQGFDETISAVLNHQETMGQHLLYYGSAAIGSLFLKIIMCRAWGAAGVVWAGTLAFAVIHAVPSVNLVRKRLRSM